VRERHGSKQIIIRAKNEKCDCGRSARSMQRMRVSRRRSLGKNGRRLRHTTGKEERMPHMPRIGGVTWEFGDQEPIFLGVPPTSKGKRSAPMRRQAMNPVA